MHSRSCSLQAKGLIRTYSESRSQVQQVFMDAACVLYMTAREVRFKEEVK